LFNGMSNFCRTHGLVTAAGEQEIAGRVGPVDQPTDQGAVRIHIQDDYFSLLLAFRGKTNTRIFTRQVQMRKA
jgi:hypothetical protein